MSGYIDSEKLKDNVKRYLEKLASHQKIPIYKPIIREISNDICFAIDMLSVDAVEVVRCENCFYGKPYNEVWYHPKRNSMWCTRNETEHDYGWFCAGGERREVQRNLNDSNALDALETEVTE